MVQAQTCHRLRGREGYKQSILRLPADNSQAHPYHHTTNAAGTDLTTQSQGLGIVNLFLHVHTHVCMCAQVCAYKCKIRLHIFRCIYIYINTYIYIYKYIYIYNNYIITYGSEVWNRGMERILQGGMERGYGTGVWNGCGPGACSGPPILTCTHIHIHTSTYHPWLCSWKEMDGTHCFQVSTRVCKGRVIENCSVLIDFHTELDSVVELPSQLWQSSWSLPSQCFLSCRNLPWNEAKQSKHRKKKYIIIMYCTIM